MWVCMAQKRTGGPCKSSVGVGQRRLRDGSRVLLCAAHRKRPERLDVRWGDFIPTEDGGEPRWFDLSVPIAHITGSTNE